MKLFKFYFLIKLVQLFNPKWKNISASVVLAQAIHETGNFTSAIFQENKNLFGMKKPSTRPNTVIGENRGHATYSSYYKSIKDYFLRQEEFNLTSISDEDQYMSKTVASGYATDTGYLTKWKNILNQIKGSISKANYLWVIIIVIVPCASLYGLYWLYKHFKKKGSKSKWKRS